MDTTNNTQLYFYDSNTGQYLPERRSTTAMDTQQAVLKLLAKVESMEQNIEVKLEAVKDKITNLDDKMANRINLVEDRVDSHCKDEEDINNTLEEHDDKLNKAEKYIDRIHSLEINYKKLVLEVDGIKKNIDLINTKPTVVKAKIIDDIVVKIRAGLMTALAGGVVAGLIWLFWFVIQGAKIGG